MARSGFSCHDRLQGALRVRRFATHLEIGFVIDQLAKPLAEERMVIHNQDAVRIRLNLCSWLQVLPGQRAPCSARALTCARREQAGHLRA